MTQCAFAKTISADVMELADVTDSKSVGSNTVRVRPPPSAPKIITPLNEWGYYFWCGGRENPQFAGRARMRDNACPKFRTMRNQQSKHNSTPATFPLSQTVIVLLFGVGANTHRAGKARMPYKMNS